MLQVFLVFVKLNEGTDSYILMYFTAEYYIVLDLSELKGKLLPVGMMIALDYVWDKVKSDRTKKKVIMIDEIWQLVGASSNRMAAEFCLTIFKTIRGFGGAGAGRGMLCERGAETDTGGNPFHYPV